MAKTKKETLRNSNSKPYIYTKSILYLNELIFGGCP